MCNVIEMICVAHVTRTTNINFTSLGENNSLKFLRIIIAKGKISVMLSTYVHFWKD